MGRRAYPSRRVASRPRCAASHPLAGWPPTSGIQSAVNPTQTDLSTRWTPASRCCSRCFFLSGFAALLYQTAWTRELSFVFGTSELAVAAVLAAYMGGLALGAAAAARYAARLRRPVLAYGVLELAIALSALAVPVGDPR